MKVIYDKETDTLSLILSQAPVAESDELRDGVIVDFDNAGRVVSVEILDASIMTEDPLTISYELKEKSA